MTKDEERSHALMVLIEEKYLMKSCKINYYDAINCPVALFTSHIFLYPF